MAEVKVTKCPPGSAKGAENSWPQRASKNIGSPLKSPHQVRGSQSSSAEMIAWKKFQSKMVKK